MRHRAVPRRTHVVEFRSICGQSLVLVRPEQPGLETMQEGRRTQPRVCARRRAHATSRADVLRRTGAAARACRTGRWRVALQQRQCEQGSTSVRSDAPVTSCAASRVKPPRNTAIRANCSRSSSARRCHDASNTTRMLRCRSFDVAQIAFRENPGCAESPAESPVD